MKTHLEFYVPDIEALCELAERFISDAVRQHPGAYVREDAMIRHIRLHIKRENEPDPKQKELPIVSKLPKRNNTASKGRPKRNDRPAVAPVLVAKQQRAAVRKGGKR